MALTNFRAAPLPNPPAQWDPQYMRQVIRVLEIYFNQLDSNTPNYAQSYTADDFYGGYFHGSGIYLNTPYGQFNSITDQTAANTYTAYPVNYDRSDFGDGVTWSVSAPSHLVVPTDGIYNILYSLEFQNTTNDIQYVDIWLRKNGVDIAETNSQFSLPARKSTGNASSLVTVTPIMVQLAANDYIQLMWRVSDTGVSMQQLPAVTASGTTPAIPATPSAIVQVQFVSYT